RKAAPKPRVRRTRARRQGAGGGANSSQAHELRGREQERELLRAVARMLDRVARAFSEPGTERRARARQSAGERLVRMLRRELRSRGGDLARDLEARRELP